MSSAIFPLVPSARSAKSAVLAASFVLFAASLGVAAQTAPAGTARASDAYRNLPLQFEQNRGQVDPSVKFVSRGQGYSIFLQPAAATFALHKAEPKPGERKNPSLKPAQGEVIRMALVGANDNAAMSAEKPLKAYVNYMTGNDRSKWRTGIPTFAQTRVSAVYPGVDLVYYGTQRQLEYDFVLAPGASARNIRFALAGAKPVLAANGELVLQIGKKSSDDDLRFRKPVLYQQAHGKRQPVDGSFTVAANGEVGFHVGPYDRARELVIDPIISYASYFGGPLEDEINGSALNSAGQLYAVGQTFSSTLPGTAGEYQATSSVA